MQRRKIDYLLYLVWIRCVLVLCCFVFAFLVIDRNSEWFELILGVVVTYAALITTSWFINVALITIILRIRLEIDKKRNPEKYKAMAEMHREIDKMFAELDKEVDELIKEKKNER